MVEGLIAAGEAADGVGLAFSRKRLFTLSEVNFLGWAWAKLGEGEAGFAGDEGVAASP